MPPSTIHILATGLTRGRHRHSDAGRTYQSARHIFLSPHASSSFTVRCSFEAIIRARQLMTLDDMREYRAEIRATPPSPCLMMPARRFSLPLSGRRYVLLRAYLFLLFTLPTRPVAVPRPAPYRPQIGLLPCSRRVRIVEISRTADANLPLATPH